ncbi:MAG: LegC family aminotransferase [Verrucomicrobia bacterium]|jgi:aminotransferase in exopolysaccharide biosynthesis|nr:LegC family aminotransferase [Verrucomicrobiota bacterium]
MNETLRAMTTTTEQLTRAVIEHVRGLYATEDFIPLHRPVFGGEEKAMLAECIDTSFVSSVGKRVDEFEARMAEFTGARHAVAVVNGTCALQVALRVAGVEPGDEVITQALTFVATANSIAHAGASPVFVDVDRETLGMSPDALEAFLESEAERRDDGCFNRGTGKRIAACMPMHTFGHPCRIEEIARICADWGIELVEDAAESLGSYRGERHTGTFGHLGVFSFNGNKIITTGGGGMIVTDDEALARHAKHLTTTAKVPHAYEFVHDEIAYNFRMPNLNAALGCAQMEQLPGFLAAKREIAEGYRRLCEELGIVFISEQAGTRASYWLNAIVLDSRDARDAFLKATNDAGVMTRPIWRLMSELELYTDCQSEGLTISKWLEERVVCLPSSVA